MVWESSVFVGLQPFMGLKGRRNPVLQRFASHIAWNRKGLRVLTSQIVRPSVRGRNQGVHHMAIFWVAC